MRQKMFLNLLLVAILLVATASGAWAHPITNVDIFYTTFQGGQNVHKVSLSYDGVTTLTLGASTNIDSTNGADGIIFAPDGDLIVGGQGNRIHKVKTDGSGHTTKTPGADVYHVMLDPSGNKVWGASIPGTLTETPLNPFASGTVHPLSGVDTTITHIAFDSLGNAFYTKSGPGGFGSFGTINLNTFTTTQLLTGVAAAHGMAFDSFTGHLMLFGDNHITQIDPANPTVFVSDRTFTGFNFDQGSVDGMGHMFVASNNGYLLFMDYSASGLVAHAGNFVTTPFLASGLDDIAPASGLGSNPVVPEPSSMLLLVTGLLVAAGVLRFRRKKS